MSDWSWVTEKDAVGEMPVRVLPKRRAEFLDFADDVQVKYELSTEEEPFPGDACILTARVTNSSREGDTTTVKVDVLDVEFLRKAGPRDLEIGEMMKHLDEARRRRQEQKSEQRCENCRIIDGDTKLSANTKYGKRDLHYCARCDRLLSSEEYQKWLKIHR